MSTTLDHPNTELIEQQLDELMPKPATPLKRWLIGASLLAIVVATGITWTMGYLVPNPFATVGWVGSNDILIPEDERVARIAALAVNGSKRSVTLTDVHLRAAGLELVEATASLQPELVYGPDDCEDLGAGSTVCSAVSEADAWAWEDQFGPGSPLPLEIPAGREAEVYLAFTVENCQASTAATDWGRADATFSFGEGAFPPFSATYPLWDRLVEPNVGSSIFTHPGAPTGDHQQTDVTAAAELLSALCKHLGPAGE